MVEVILKRALIETPTAAAAAAERESAREGPLILTGRVKVDRTRSTRLAGNRPRGARNQKKLIVWPGYDQVTVAIRDPENGGVWNTVQKRFEHTMSPNIYMEVFRCRQISFAPGLWKNNVGSGPRTIENHFSKCGTNVESFAGAMSNLGDFLTFPELTGIGDDIPPNNFSFFARFSEDTKPPLDRPYELKFNFSWIEQTSRSTTETDSDKIELERKTETFSVSFSSLDNWPGQ